MRFSDPVGLVTVASSAGSLAALGTILGNLRAGLGAAVGIVQHRTGQTPGLCDELLEEPGVMRLDCDGEDDHGIENVGGPTLGAGFALVGRGGSLQRVGVASLEPTTIEFEVARRRGLDRRIEVFTIGSAPGADLGYLVWLLAELGGGR